MDVSTAPHGLSRRVHTQGERRTRRAARRGAWQGSRRWAFTAPALYRYFPSRDDLLTEPILSAYQGLALVVEDAAGSDEMHPGGLVTVAMAIRAWALANPYRYLVL